MVMLWYSSDKAPRYFEKRETRHISVLSPSCLGLTLPGIDIFKMKYRRTTLVLTAIGNRRMEGSRAVPATLGMRGGCRSPQLWYVSQIEGTLFRC